MSEAVQIGFALYARALDRGKRVLLTTGSPDPHKAAMGIYVAADEIAAISRMLAAEAGHHLPQSGGSSG